MDGRGSLRIASSVRESTGEAIVSVSDDGPGIPSETADQVFDLFFTTKAQGTGVGLAMAKRLVEQQGGRLEVASRPREGTEFRVVLGPMSATRSA